MKNFLLLLVATIGITLSLEAQQGIGIGTTMPNSKSILELSSTTKGLLIPRMTSTQRTAITTPPQGLMVFQNNGTTSLGFWYHDGTSWQRFAKASELSGSSSWTVSGDNQYSSVDGNVGIGMTSAINHKLSLKGNMFLTHVNGNDISNGGNVARLYIHGANTGSGIIDFLRPDTTSGATIGYSWTGNVMSMRHAASTNYMRFYSDGNIGIGTGLTSSQAETSLHIASGAEASLTTHGYLILGSVTGTNLVMDANEIQARSNGALSPLNLQQGGGAVKIGSGTAADTRLHITGGNDATLSEHGYLLLGSVFGENIVMDQNSIQARINGAIDILSVQNYGGDFRVNNIGLVVHGTSGFTGLGTASPAARLHVAGDGIFNGTDPTLAFHQAGVQKGFVQLAGNNFRVGTFGDNDLGSFVVRTNGGDRFFVAPSGNVGVGTSNPLGKLDVAGNLRIAHSGEAIGIDGNNSFIQFYQNGIGKFYMQQQGNNMVMATASGNSTGRLHLWAAEVAINTAGPAPGYSLSVGGEIICEELRVELAPNGPWPDYVFAQDYNLRPLDELKSFISTNKHLPNIPAAAQVENEGFDVGDMNRRLLEKVEELTLYIIQQQEEIDEMKKEIEEIKN